MARGTFVVAVELLPPRGYQIDQIVEGARRLKIGGVDLVCIPDGQRAGARISALSLAVLIEQRAGIETLLQYSCRDRNLLGIQSDLLGAHAMGLRNLMLVTGDPGRVGDYPDATAVFDVDSIGLTNLASRLNHGCDVGGQAIGAPTGFHLGVSVNPSAPNLDDELRRFEYKVEAGAEFVVTRPVFDLQGFERFLKRIEHARLPVIAAVYSRSRARGMRISWRTRCLACSCRTRCSTGCARQAMGGRPRPRVWRFHGKSRPVCAEAYRVCKSRHKPVTSRRPWQSWMDFADGAEV